MDWHERGNQHLMILPSKNLHKHFYRQLNNARQILYDFYMDENNNLFIGRSEGLYIKNGKDGSIRYQAGNV